MHCDSTYTGHIPRNDVAVRLPQATQDEASAPEAAAASRAAIVIDLTTIRNTTLLSDQVGGIHATGRQNNVLRTRLLQPTLRVVTDLAG